MTRLGIIGLINFGDWDNPDYQEAGGINSVIKNILPFLRANRIYLYGITSNKESLFVEKRISEIISVFPIIYLRPNGFLPRRVLGFVYGWKLWKYFRRHKIDFVYSHSEELCFWLIWGATPYIHHLHTFVNALEVSGGKLAQMKIFRVLWDWIRTSVIRNAYRIVAVNSDVANLGARLIGAARVIEFPNFVNTSIFKFVEAEILKEQLEITDAKVCLFIGRISPVKGMELLVDIIELMQESEEKWMGIIVGKGEYEVTLKSYIAVKKMENRFIFVGSINKPEELRMYYSLADVFLITSISESVPLTLLESLACGTPVISTDVGICSNVLMGSNGFVIKSRDPHEFSKMVPLCLSLKSKESLLPSGSFYSVENASNLLNKEFSA